jgi:hypothetical protein
MYLKNQHDAHVLAYLRHKLNWHKVPLAWRLVLAALVWWQRQNAPSRFGASRTNYRAADGCESSQQCS